MSANAVRAGKAEVEIGVKDRMKAGLDAAQRRLQAFGKGLSIAGGVVGGFGAGVVAPLVAMATQFASVGDSIHKMSARTGAAAEDLSTLGFAAEQSGADLDTVERGFIGMAKSMAAANEGSKAQVDAFNAIGLSVDQLNGLDPAEQFRMIAQGISEVEDPTVKAGLAMDIFGKSGQKLIPLLNEGSDGIMALQDEARSLGLEMSGDAANSAAALTDAMNRLKRASGAIAIVMGEAVAPILTEVIGPVVGITKAVVGWMKENKGLVATVFLVGASLMGIGAAISALGVAAMTGAAGMGLLGSVMGFLVSGPVLAIAATLAAIGAGVYLFRDQITAIGSQFWDSIEPARVALGEILSIVTETFDGVRGALAAGDFSAAARILWLGIQAAFYEGAEIAGMAFEWLFGEATGWLKGIADAIMTGNFSLAFDVAWAQIKVAFGTGTMAVSKLWAFFVFGLGETFGEAISGIERAFFGATSYISGLLESVAGKLSSLLETLAEYDPTGVAGQTAAALKAAQVALSAGSQQFAQLQEQEEQARNARREQRMRDLYGKLYAAEKDLADKRAERDRLTSKASEDRAKLDMTMAEKKRAELRDLIDSIQVPSDVSASDTKDLSGSTDSLPSLKYKQAGGTFSAMGAALMGLDVNAANQTAENTRKTAIEMAKATAILGTIANKPSPPGPLFS